MGKVRNASNTLRTGRIGENTWYIRDGEQIVRQRLNNSNYGEGARRSMAQQERRAKWGNLVNFFKVIAEIERSAYEGKERGVTDYNMFMKLNANSTPIYLTRQQVDAGGCVPAGFVVSKGSLPAITETAAVVQGTAINALMMGWPYRDGMFTEGGTVKSLSDGLVQYAENYQYGDNIALLVVGFQEDAEDVPRAVFTYDEFTLSETDTTPLDDVGFTFTILDDNRIRLETLLRSSATTIGGCVIHTRQSGELLVSSQSIVVTNQAGLADYVSAAQRTAAINSYGVDGKVVLSPGT